MTKNTPVGTSECPIKNCALTVQVFKYRNASEDPTKRRFAGRLYCVCDAHGRVENQEFLLEHIQWASDQKPAPADASHAPKPPAAPVKQTPEKHASRPVSPPPQKVSTSSVSPEPPPAKKSDPWLPEFFK